MNIPSKLKVGGLTYTVIITEKIDDDTCAAFLDTQTLKIKVEKAAPEAMVHNFIHEIVHAINTEIPEQTVEYFAMLLHQVIVDNPELFKGGERKHGQK